MERFASGTAGPASAPSTPAVHRDLAVLTPREREVLTLGEATVKTHVARIFAKLTLRDRAQTVVLANETGPVSPRP